MAAATPLFKAKTYLTNELCLYYVLANRETGAYPNRKRVVKVENCYTGKEETFDEQELKELQVRPVTPLPEETACTDASSSLAA